MSEPTALATLWLGALAVVGLLLVAVLFVRDWRNKQ